MLSWKYSMTQTKWKILLYQTSYLVITNIGFSTEPTTPCFKKEIGSSNVVILHHWSMSLNSAERDHLCKKQVEWTQIVFNDPWQIKSNYWCQRTETITTPACNIWIFDTLWCLWCTPLMLNWTWPVLAWKQFEETGQDIGHVWDLISMSWDM